MTRLVQALQSYLSTTYLPALQLDDLPSDSHEKLALVLSNTLCTLLLIGGPLYEPVASQLTREIMLNN